MQSMILCVMCLLHDEQKDQMLLACQSLLISGSITCLELFHAECKMDGAQVPPHEISSNLLKYWQNLAQRARGH